MDGPFSLRRFLRQRAGAHLASMHLAAGIVILAAIEQIAAQSRIGGAQAQDALWRTPQAFYEQMGYFNAQAASVLFHPALLAARMFGGAQTDWMAAEIFFAILCVIVFCEYILRRQRIASLQESGFWRNAALWLVLLGAGADILKPGHIALLFALPPLAAQAARACGSRPHVPSFALAGVAAGLAISIRPYMSAVFLGGAFAASCLKRSQDRYFVTENIVAALTFLFFCAFALSQDPNFLFGPVPQAIAVVAPQRHLLGDTLFSWPFIASAVILIVFAIYDLMGRSDPRAIVCACASVGFFFTCLTQKQLSFSDAYPGLVLALFAILIQRSDLPIKRSAFLNKINFCLSLLFIAPVFRFYCAGGALTV